MAKLGKFLTAMVTPFDDDLNPDYDRMAELAVRLVDEGCEGLVVAGTTGESPTLRDSEKLQAYACVAEAVGDRASVVAGTGGNSTDLTASLTEKAADTGVDAVMLVGPYYNKPSQRGLYEHFRACASRTELPVILYNVPSRTGKSIDPETILALASDLPNIAAAKEATPALDEIARICAEAPEGFVVYSGEDALTLPMMSCGAVGAISVTGHVVGSKIREMIDSYHAGDVVNAAHLHQEMRHINKACFLESGNPACVKRALELCGFPVGGVRPPLWEASGEDTAIILDACRGLGIAG